MASKEEVRTEESSSPQKTNEALKQENEELRNRLVHFTDEMRFALGIAIQARPEIKQLHMMVEELYRIEK